MAVIKAFRGLRPPREIVKELASRPYDVLDSDEARTEAGGNMYSLLHVIKPEIDLPPDVDHYAREVYDKAVRTLPNSGKTDGWSRMRRNACTSTPRP